MSTSPSRQAPTGSWPIEHRPTSSAQPDESRRWLRRLLLFGTPVAMGVVSILHPKGGASASVPASLQPRLGLWLGVHLVQLVLVGLLGLTIWTLVEGRLGKAAVACRLAIPAFLVFYSAFDSVVGLGTGVLVSEAQRITGGEQAGTHQLIEDYWLGQYNPAGPAFYVYAIVIGLAELSWLVAVGSAALSLQRGGENRMSAALLVLAGILFALGHPFPTGTAAMACLLAAVVLLERAAQGRAVRDRSQIVTSSGP